MCIGQVPHSPCILAVSLLPFWRLTWKVYLAAMRTRFSPFSCCWLIWIRFLNLEAEIVPRNLGGTIAVEVMECRCKGQCGINFWENFVILLAEFMYAWIELRIFEEHSFMFVINLFSSLKMSSTSSWMTGCKFTSGRDSLSSYHDVHPLFIRIRFPSPS